MNKKVITINSVDRFKKGDKDSNTTEIEKLLDVLAEHPSKNKNIVCCDNKTYSFLTMFDLCAYIDGLYEIDIDEIMRKYNVSANEIQGVRYSSLLFPEKSDENTSSVTNTELENDNANIEESNL